MLSKNPLDLLRENKFSKEELADALRLSIIAELDAINLYLQLARMVEDEKFRKVFEDIAREEKTHVGEFLALLKTIDQEQVEELVKGFEEVKELTGLSIDTGKTDPEKEGNSWDFVADAFREAVEKYRSLRKHLPLTRVGEGVESIVTYTNGFAEQRVIGLREISVKFEIPERIIQYSSKNRDRIHLDPVVSAASRMGIEEDRYIVKGDLERGYPGLLTCRESVSEVMSSWDQAGEALNDVYRAVEKLYSNGYAKPYILLLNPSRYAKLVAIHERTGVTELQRIKQIVDEVVSHPAIPVDEAVLFSSNPQHLDLVIGVDTRVDYIGLENGNHVFRAWETLVLRIKDPKAIIHMRVESK